MKLRHYDGAIAEVDDETGKKLLALPGNDWTAVRKPRAVKPTEEKPEE